MNKYDENRVRTSHEIFSSPLGILGVIAGGLGVCVVLVKHLDMWTTWQFWFFGLVVLPIFALTGGSTAMVSTKSGLKHLTPSSGNGSPPMPAIVLCAGCAVLLVGVLMHFFANALFKFLVSL